MVSTVTLSDKQAQIIGDLWDDAGEKIRRIWIHESHVLRSLYDATMLRNALLDAEWGKIPKGVKSDMATWGHSQIINILKKDERIGRTL